MKNKRDKKNNLKAKISKKDENIQCHHDTDDDLNV